MPYTAKLVQDTGRTYFSVSFRHPVKKDRHGRYGLKVRRGLGTSDRYQAEALVGELNQILADESLHRPTARAEVVQRGFSDVIIEAFFRDIEPTPSSGFVLRDTIIPLPGTAEGYSSVLLLGTTGSGKSTLVRQILGTDPKTDRFPSTAPGRTTVADQEFVLTERGGYRAVVCFHSRDLVAVWVEDSLAAAALAHLAGRKHADVARAFLAPQEGRLRLAYILGQYRPHDSGSDGDTAGSQTKGDSGAVSEIVRRVTEIADRAAAHVASERDQDMVALLRSDDRESVEQDLDEFLRDDEEFMTLTDDVVEDIASRFDVIRAGEFTGRIGGWPSFWSIELGLGQRSEFFDAIRPFIGIAAAQHGTLLTPVVEGLRVAGPFSPTWSDGTVPKLVLLDGEGVGHNPATLRSLPPSVTERVPMADRVLLVDSAKAPMLEGPILVARTLERMGEDAKLHLCFTHFDLMEDAENLPEVRDRVEHVASAARVAVQHLARELGRTHLAELERAVEERSFFVGGIQETLSEHHPVYREQLSALLEQLQAHAEPIAEEASPEYDLANFVIAVQWAVDEFIETYRARLRLPSKRTLQAVPWQTAKAATRYTSQFGLDGYGVLRPGSDFASILGERLSRFVSQPVRFRPDNCSDEAKERATARIRQALAQPLEAWVRRRLIDNQLNRWLKAYEYRGTGSTRLRAYEMDTLNLIAVPPMTDQGDAAASQFVDELRQLVRDAIHKGGGDVRGEP